MPKLELTEGEIQQINGCIDTELRSLKTYQTRSKYPELKAVYERQEQTLHQLKNKLLNIK